MAFSSPYPPETRTAVETMLRETGLSMRAVAARIGVPRATVRFWNRRAGIRPRRAAGATGAPPRPPVDPWTWTQRRRQAVQRLVDRHDPDPRDLAQALGLRRRDGARLQAAFGCAPDRARTGSEPPGGIPDPAALAAALRSHVARQIAVFDRRLRAAGAGADGARILRDLGGLKRLLDDLRTEPDRTTCEGDADGGAPPDLAGLRERLARRIEAFVGERPDAGLAGEPGRGPAAPARTGLAGAGP